jgi:hypothetical protein
LECGYFAKCEVVKVIIAGSRNFYNYELLKSECDRILKGLSDIEIVSGTAKGADFLGERYALGRGYKLTKFPAKWKTYGNMAGPFRNREMAEYADTLICFWDFKSRGSKNMIETATRLYLKVYVVPSWL